MKTINGTILLVAATLVLSGCMSGNTKPELATQNSGYLSQHYYGKLQRVDMPSEQLVYRYISPDFKAEDYQQVIVDPVTVYPRPKATKNMSEATLVTLRNKLTILMKNTVSKVLPLTETPDKGVIRLQTAITGVNISDKEMAAYEYIPIAFVVSSVKDAATGRAQSVKLYLETKAIDAYSNQVVAVSVRHITGEDLENAQAKLRAQQLNEGIKMAGKDMAGVLKDIFN